MAKYLLQPKSMLIWQICVTKTNVIALTSTCRTDAVAMGTVFTWGARKPCIGRQISDMVGLRLREG